MLKYAGDNLSHALIADTMKHCHYIVNPPGVNAVILQHIGISEREVDFSFWLSGKNGASGCCYPRTY